MSGNAVGHERQCVASAVVRWTDEDGWEHPTIDPDTGHAVRRRCHKFALRGSTVCDSHATPNAKAAAKRRLEHARDLAVERILAELESVEPDIALKAAALALKHGPKIEDEDDGLSALRSALDEVREAADEALRTDSDEAG